MHTLSDLPDLLPDLRLLVIHGEGRGGGERAAAKINDAYRARGRTIDVIGSGNRRALKAAIQALQGVPGTLVLFSGGMRDLPGALAARTAGVGFAAYFQVPYLRSLSISDPVHASAVMAMVGFNRLFAHHIFVNSGQGWPQWLQGRILLPIVDAERIVPHPVKWPVAKLVRLATACRLFSERGHGSKDVSSVLRLIEEVRAHNRTQDGQRIELVHYGDVDAYHTALLDPHRDVLERRGYATDWYTADAQVNGYFFFSHYEGFGLAPLEATKTGYPVFVNEGFPPELLACGPVRRIVTGDIRRPILGQMVRI